MSKKEKFINVVEDLFRKTDMEVFAGDDYDDVMIYFQALKMSDDDGKEKVAFTENGKIVLTFMKENAEVFGNMFKAKDCEGAGISSKTASGALRKLVTDGYVEKLGKNPVIYSLTDKGKEVDLSAE